MNSISQSDSTIDTPIETIQFYYNGIQVIGKIFIRTKRDLGIEMTSPYNGFQTGIHKPYFADPRSSYLDEEGLEYAKSLLNDLYEQLRNLERKSEEIDRLYPAFIQERNDLQACILDCKTSLANEKRRMKSHIINPIEYQRTITPINKLIKDLEYEIFALEKQFFENLTNTIIPYTLRMDYIKFLDEKHSK
ncbi:hypothetical protein AB3N58_06875 [Leptospira sp. WS60.C2]